MIFYTDSNILDDQQIGDFASKNGISKMVAKILFKRGINTDKKLFDFLNPTFLQLENPYNLNGMSEAVERIKKAILNKENILLYGDYDVDGVCAVSVLYKFFIDQKITPSYYLPNRFEDGYGLTLETAQKVITEFRPNLIITVDCGISSYKEIEFLKQNNIDVIVTDHHEIPENLPNCIIVNPKMKGQIYSSDSLCGTGVAFKIVQAMENKENLAKYLPIVAIATVADIVPLKDENRALVKLGLQNTNLLPEGVKILIRDLNKNNELNSGDIAFKLAPKINSAGRMGDATISLRLFVENDKQTLENLAQRLTEMNTKRQTECARVFDECYKILQENRDEFNRAIILKAENWDSGLLGITCARLVEEFNRPVFLFSNFEGKLRGSARSINGLNIHQVLSSCKHLLTTFGGHSMAAGLTMPAENFEQFKAIINNYLTKNFDEELFVQKKYYDEEVLVDDINVKLVSELNMLEPFGCENNRPIFKISFQKNNVYPLKNFPQHLSVNLNKKINLLGFNLAEETQKLKHCQTKTALIDMQLDNFRNKISIKGIIKNVIYEGFNKGNEDLLNGLYFKQMLPKTVHQLNENKVFYFDDNNLKTTVLEKLKNKFGTLLVINSLKSYNALHNDLKQFQLNYFVSGVNNLTKENSISFGLDKFTNLKFFDNIIFIDPILNENYLKNFNNLNIYAPQNTNNQKFEIDLNRNKLGNFYLTLKDSLSKIVTEQNEHDYYLSFKRLNPNYKNLTFTEFVAYVNVFADLNLIEITIDNNYHLSLKSTEKTDLNYSQFYNLLLEK